MCGRVIQTTPAGTMARTFGAALNGGHLFEPGEYGAGEKTLAIVTGKNGPEATAITWGLKAEWLPRGGAAAPHARGNYADVKDFTNVAMREGVRRIIAGCVEVASDARCRRGAADNGVELRALAACEDAVEGLGNRREAVIRTRRHPRRRRAFSGTPDATAAPAQFRAGAPRRR